MRLRQSPCLAVELHAAAPVGVRSSRFPFLDDIYVHYIMLQGVLPSIQKQLLTKV